MNVRGGHVVLAVWLGLVVSASGRAQNGDDLVPGMSATGAPPRRPASAAPAPPGSPAPAPRRPAAPPSPVPQLQRPAAGSAPVAIAASVDRTAVWIGEPFVYTVDVICPPGTDVLATDISRDRLRPTGLEVMEATQTRTVDDDGTIRYRSRFILASFLIDGSAARLEPQPVRYYVHTAGQSADTLVPADEIALAPVTIAVRSALPDNDVSWLRDARPVVRMPAVFTVLAPIGYVLGGLSLLPLAYGVGTLVRGRLPKLAARPAKHTREYRARIEDARALDASTPAGRLAALQAISAVVRERLSDIGIPALGLTPDEIEPVLAEKGPTLTTLALDIVKVLRLCERALYGGPEQLPPAGEVAPAFELAEQLLAARAR